MLLQVLIFTANQLNCTAYRNRLNLTFDLWFVGVNFLQVSHQAGVVLSKHKDDSRTFLKVDGSLPFVKPASLPAFGGAYKRLQTI